MLRRNEECPLFPAQRLWRLALVGLAITLVHPHDILTVAGILLAFIAVRVLTARSGERGAEARRGARVLLALGLGAAPLSTYHLTVLLSDPSYRYYAQHVHAIYTERWPMDFGLILAAAVVGAALIVLRRERDRALLVVWPAVLAVFLSSPEPQVQRSHLLYGLHVVLCALAVRGLWAAGWRLRGPSRKMGSGPVFPRTAALGLALFATAASVTNAVKYVDELRPHVPRAPNFLRAEEVAALDYLDRTARNDETIACLAPVGAGVPLWTGSRVFVGHMELSSNYPMRAQWMERLLSPSVTAGVAAEILRNSRADWIYVDSSARRRGSQAAERVLVESDLATREFSNKWTAVYRVNRITIR